MALRVGLAWGRVGPVIFPDEAGYLINARVIAGWPIGHPSLNMHFDGGYAALLAPIFWFVHDPVTSYRWALAENALLTALLFPLTYALAHRGFGLPRRLSLALAFASATLPGVVFYSLLTWSDAILPVVVTGWLLAVALWLRGERRAPLWAACSAVAAAYAATVHARGGVIAALEIVLLLIVMATHRRLRRSSAVGAATMVLALTLALVFNAWIDATHTPSGGADFTLLSFSSRASLVGPTLLRTIGALWSNGIATFGASFAALAIGSRLVARRSLPGHQRATAAIAILATVAIAASSSWNAAAGDEHRIGNWAYSRYISCLVPALVVVGIWALTEQRRRGARAYGLSLAITAAAFAVVAAVLSIGAHHQLSTYYFSPFDFPETMPLVWRWDSVSVVATTAVVLGLMGLIVLLARRVTWAVALLAVVVPVSIFANTAVDAHETRPWEAQFWPHHQGHLANAGITAPMRVGVYGAGFMEWAEMSWEVPWTTVPIIWNFYSPIDGFDAIAIPWDAGQQITSAGAAYLNSHGWHRVYLDHRWGVWTR